MTRKQNTESVDTTAEVQVEKLTPFEAHKLVNARLAAEGIDKKIPPQMMYNYTSGRVRQGKKPFFGWTKEDGVDRESFDEWLDRYIEKLRPSSHEEQAAEVPAEVAEDIES